MAYEALVLLLLLALLLFITRLWPILLLVILGIFAGALRLLFLSSQKVRSIQPPASASAGTAVDPELDSFSRLQAVITERVQEDCPGAKWVWENRNPRRSIRLGEPVAILLNRAGGYRRAELRLSDGELTELIYESFSEKAQNVKPAQPETVYGEPMPENYEMASDDHSMVQELRERIAMLEEPDRSIVTMQLEGYSYEEIGAHLGMTEKNVSVRLVRIKEKLRKLMEK